MIKLLTSEYLEGIESTDFEQFTECGEFRYQLTPDEITWLEWIGDRYAITTYLGENTDENGVLTLDTHEVSEAMEDDDVDRGPCLSEDTQLNRLLFCIFYTCG